MKITVSLEDQHPEDLFVQHMAEQTDFGDTEAWIGGLIDKALQEHPHFRVCSSETCDEVVYPTMTVRPVADETWKRYRVATAPTEHCPACGSVTKAYTPYEHSQDSIDHNAAFAAGRRFHRDGVAV